MANLKIEYRDNPKIGCRDIDIWLSTYTGPVGYADDILQETRGFTPIANITGEDSFHNIQMMFDCKKYDIIVTDAAGDDRGKVIYAKKK